MLREHFDHCKANKKCSCLCRNYSNKITLKDFGNLVSDCSLLSTGGVVERFWFGIDFDHFFIIWLNVIFLGICKMQVNQWSILNRTSEIQLRFTSCKTLTWIATRTNKVTDFIWIRKTYNTVLSYFKKKMLLFLFANGTVCGLCSL